MAKTKYTRKYYKEITFPSARSAEHTIPVIKEFIFPSSVVDVGCGTGTWLQAWKNNGVHTILGIDGEYVDKNQLLIDKDYFKSSDLEKELVLSTKYELVMSLEVAEHLKKDAAETFIKSLCSAGNIVLFSAAIPFQGGVQHINEQYPDYWVRLFHKYNFTPYDCIREKIWDNTEINICYRQNIMFFVHDDYKENYPSITKPNHQPLSVVHPEFYEYKERDLSAHKHILKTPFHANYYFIKKYIKFLLTKIGLWKN